VRDFQHDRPGHASILFGPERLGAAGEREYGPDEWPQLARLDHPSEFDEVRAVGFDDEEDVSGV
jgi:hypothetical protein